MSARILAGLACAVVALAIAAPARAVCPPPPASESGVPFLAAPRDGASDVPANATLIVHWPDPPPFCEGDGLCGGVGHRLLLRDDHGLLVKERVNSFWSFGPAPRQTRQVSILPQEPLVPGREYHIVWSRPDGSEEVLGFFTAGPPILAGPPAPPVVTGVDVGPLHTCGAEDFGCCVDTPVRRITVHVAPAQQPVTYATGGTFDQSELVGLFYCEAKPSFDFVSAPGVITPFVLGGGAHELEVTASAPTGWTSTPAIVDVFASCDPLAPDAGPVGPPPPHRADAGHVDAGAAPADGGGGCRVVAGRARPGSAPFAALAAFAALGLGARRRRLALAACALCACGSGGAASPPLAAAPACEVPQAAYQLASLATCPYGLAVDDTHLYWFDSRLARFPKCGSADPPATVATLAGADLVVDDDALYYLADDKVLRQAKDGGPVTTLAEGFDGTPQGLVGDGDSLYVSVDLACVVGDPCTDDRALLQRIGKDGSARTPVIRAGGFQLFDVAVDDAHAFFSGNVKGLDGQLGRVDKRGGAPEPLALAGASGSPTRLAVDGDALYAVVGASIYRAAKSGGAATAIVEDSLQIQDLALDADHVYWVTTDFQGSGQVRRAKKDGSELTTLADAPDPQALEVDEGAVYYTTCGRGLSAGVWIVAK